jgi:hypothetical protein
MAERSNASVCGQSLTGITGSKPAGGKNFCHFVCCQVVIPATGRSLVHKSLPTVMTHCECSRNLKNEAALARVGLLCHSIENYFMKIFSVPDGAFLIPLNDRIATDYAFWKINLFDDSASTESVTLHPNSHREESEFCGLKRGPVLCQNSLKKKTNKQKHISRWRI